MLRRLHFSFSPFANIVLHIAHTILSIMALSTIIEEAKIAIGIKNTVTRYFQVAHASRYSKRLGFQIKSRTIGFSWIRYTANTEGEHHLTIFPIIGLIFNCLKRENSATALINTKAVLL